MDDWSANCTLQVVDQIAQSTVSTYVSDYLNMRLSGRLRHVRAGRVFTAKLRSSNITTEINGIFSRRLEDFIQTCIENGDQVPPFQRARIHFECDEIHVLCRTRPNDLGLFLADIIPFLIVYG